MDGQRSSPTGQPPAERARSRSDARQPRGDRRGPPFVSEGLDLEVLGSSSEGRGAKEGRRHRREAQREKQTGARERPWKDAEEGRLEGGARRGRTNQEGKAASAERLGDPSPLRREAGPGSRERQERRPRSHERPPRPPHLLVGDEGASVPGDRHRKGREEQSPSSETSLKPPGGLEAEDGEERERRRRDGRAPNHDQLRRHEGRESPGPSSRDRRLLGPGTTPQRGHRRPGEREGAPGWDRVPPVSPSRHGESLDPDARRHRPPGTKSRETKEAAAYSKPRRAPAQDQESHDAEIARKLQEEELLASQVDKRAAQVAQDEEIARLLMAKEKAAYRKAREREKSSTEKKRQDPDRKHDTAELVRPRSREGHEPHGGRSDKPTRPPPPPTEDLDHLVNLTSLQNSPAHQIPKPDSSQKGYHYKP